VASLCLVGAAPLALASLVGSNVHLNLNYDLDGAGPGGTQFSGNAVVGAGLEFNVPICSDCIGGGGSGEGTLQFDLAAFTITFSQVSSPFPDILLFDALLTNLDFGPGAQIVGVTAAEQNAFTIGFTGNSLHIQNLQNFNPPSNFTNVYTLQVETVPEPSTLAVVGLGLVALAAARRRRV